MNKYEILYIIDNDVSEEDKAALVDRFSDLVVKLGGPTRKPTSRHTSKTTIITTPGCAKVDAARWPHLLCLILLFGPAGKIRRECCADASPAFPEA